MRPDIAPGGTFPDYELPDHTSVPRRLSELQGDDPMILTLARGHYCPKEHQQHLELAAFYSKVAVAYTRIATISTDDHHTLQEFRASVGAQWAVLSDPDRTVHRDLDIQEYTDPETDRMIPHALATIHKKFCSLIERSLSHHAKRYCAGRAFPRLRTQRLYGETTQVVGAPGATSDGAGTQPRGLLSEGPTTG